MQSASLIVLVQLLDERTSHSLDHRLEKRRSDGLLGNGPDRLLAIWTEDVQVVFEGLGPDVDAETVMTGALGWKA